MDDIQYGIEQPLRFFEKEQHLNHNRAGALRAFKLYCPATHLLPFQIKRIAGIRDLTSLILRERNSVTQVMDLLANIEASDISKLSFENYDYIIHYGQEPLITEMVAGEYILVASDNTTTWYSEVITVVDFNKDNLTNSCIKTKIEYWDKNNVGDLFYRAYQFNGKQYRNVMYLDIELGLPEWEVETEGEDDALGVFEADTITREKEYILQGVYPEYFADALTMLPLHTGVNGRIQVTTHYGYTTEIKKVGIDEATWIGGEGGAGRDVKMTISLSSATIFKTNCATAIEPLTACVRNTTEYTTLLLEGSSHYTNGTFVQGIETKPITHNALVMVEYLSGVVLLRRFDSEKTGDSRYKSTFIDWSKGAVFVNANLPILTTEPHLFWGGSSAIGFLSEPVLLSLAGTSGGGTGAAAGFGLPMVRGRVANNTLIELWKKQGEGDEADTLVQDLPPSAVNGSGYAAAISAGSTYYIKSIGLSCELGTSNEKTA